MSSSQTKAGFAISLLQDTGREWINRRALRLSAALAYYSIFSIAPLLILALGMAGWLWGQEAAQNQLEGQLREVVGEHAAQAIQSLVKSASHPAQSRMATLVGGGFLLLGASGVFGQLKDALNLIWAVKSKPGVGFMGLLRKHLLAFGMVLLIGLLLLASLILSTLLTASNQWIKNFLVLPQWVWGSTAFVVSLALMTALFAIMFKVLPDAVIDWRHAWRGAAATAFFFEIGKVLLSLYLGRESAASGFGAAQSLVLLLLWVYYASCILLFGAQFTKTYAEATGARLQPSEFGKLMNPTRESPLGFAPQNASPGAAPEPKPSPQPGDPVWPTRQPVAMTGALPRPGDSGKRRRPPSAHPVLSLVTVAGLGAALGWVARR